jgi:hypothetical protein
VPICRCAWPLHLRRQLWPSRICEGIRRRKSQQLCRKPDCAAANKPRKNLAAALSG